MYYPTSNPYQFKYLITSFSGGTGIEQVYLPEQPHASKILNHGFRKADQIWRRTELPADWKKWRKEEKTAQAKDPDYVHPKLYAFIKQEWDRRNDGLWIYINGEARYLTGTHYYYLNWWKCDFGYPRYRDNDKEVFYFIKFCEQDPNCYGPMYNTRRRSGKSAIMGAWMVEGVTKFSNCYGGIQGESEKKVQPFFNLSVVQPFKKLPDFFQPVYDTSSTQKKDIKLYAPVARGRKRLVDEDEEIDQLESEVNWQGSDIYAYDGRKLHYCVIEEPGKTTEVNVSDRHDVLKPCAEEDDDIIGCIFYGTTVEEMEGAGAVYEKMAEGSDYDAKKENGQTETGLYFSFMPAFCNYMFDDFGDPLVQESLKKLTLKRDALKNEPTKYAGVIRKYPFTVREAFYKNSDKCEFNVQILQDRYTELMQMPNHVAKGNFVFEDPDDPMSRVIWTSDKSKGHAQVAWLPEEEAATNRVECTGFNKRGVPQWKPLNDKKFCIGIDPIQYGTTVDMKRASKPVIYVKRKYDPEIDGYMDAKLRTFRSEELFENGVLVRPKFQYQTNLNIVRYAYRPTEPTYFYEYVIKLCHFFGCKIEVEAQKAGGLLAHMKLRGYSEFIAHKFVMDPDAAKQAKAEEFEGTAATTSLIQEYTALLATDVQFFGHCYNFKEQIADMLEFDPRKPTKHDDTVAAGFTEFGAYERHKEEREPVDMSQFMRTFNNRGTTSVAIK